MYLDIYTLAITSEGLRNLLYFPLCYTQFFHLMLTHIKYYRVYARPGVMVTPNAYHGGAY